MFIDESDRPELLKSTVNSKPGFRLLPKGEDDDAIFFTSARALKAWAEELEQLAAYPQDAQPYEEWLETNG